MERFIHFLHNAGPHPDDPDDNDTLPEDEYEDTVPDDLPYPRGPFE